MKVTQIKSYSVADSEGRPYFIVKVETDAGIYGLGEAGIRFWGSAIAKAIQHLSEIVVGEDPFSTERLWQHMFRGGFFPADKVYCCAISAIDIALWDIKGKAVGMPVYKLLGGPVRDKVVCYPHTQGSTTAALVDNCKGHVDAGWKFVRWGQPETSGTFEHQGDGGRLEPVESMRIAEEQMGLVRDAVGPDIQLCFDVHTRLDTAHVVAMCKSMAWIGASVAIFVPLLAWNILKLARRERSIDEQLRMAVESAVWVDDQIKSFLHNALSNPWYGVAKCYAFGSIVGRYPTRDVDVVIQFDSSKQGRVRICRERLRSIESSFQEFHCLKLHVQTFLLAENEALGRFLNKAGFHERIL